MMFQCRGLDGEAATIFFAVPREDSSCYVLALA